MKSFRDFNVVLINLDGLRKDKIDLCPFLRNFQEKNWNFQNMFTVAPYTFASLHAVFSSTYPSKNGVNAYYNMFKFKNEQCITLAEILKSQNYFTSCDIISNSVMPKKGIDDWNLFDEKTVNFIDRHTNLIRKLSNKKKFFVFLHYTEVHKNLVREIVEKYKDNEDEFFNAIKENDERYNSQLPACDDYVSSIIKTLKEEGIWDKTILVIFSDHGASIGEKIGEKFYGTYTYDYTIRVCCNIRTPGGIPTKISNQCSTIDIFPTILELLGISEDLYIDKIQGKSLIPLMENVDSKDRDIYVETGGLYGPWPSPKKHNVFCIRTKNRKLIYNDEPESWEFYDLTKDPEENNNIYDENIIEITELKNKMKNHLKKNNIKTKLEIK